MLVATISDIIAKPYFNLNFNFKLEDEIALFAISPPTQPPTHPPIPQIGSFVQLGLGLSWTLK